MKARKINFTEWGTLEKMSVLEGIAQAYYQQFTMIPKITHKINTVSNG